MYEKYILIRSFLFFVRKLAGNISTLMAMTKCNLLHTVVVMPVDSAAYRDKAMLLSKLFFFLRLWFAFLNYVSLELAP